MTRPSSLYLLCHSFNEGITCWQLMQPNVHISTMTTLPRRSARRSGESTFSQVSFVSSGAGPRSGREDGFCLSTSACCAAHPKRTIDKNPINQRFMFSLLDAPIVRKLPYEKITLG